MTDHRATAADHRPERIRARLHGRKAHDYLGDAVLGALDGCVTTFAVVAGATGGALAPFVVIILGFANLIADGFSMAVGNYHATKSQNEHVDKIRRREKRHIDEVPEGEREEIRQIFADKGFEGETLEEVVDTITSSRKVWVDTMLTEEYGLTLDGPDPIKAALATFIAFLAAGLVPLLPYLVGALEPATMFRASCVVTAFAFFAIGWLKARQLEQPRLRGALQTLLTGGAAAILAYIVGHLLRSWIG